MYLMDIVREWLANTTTVLNRRLNKLWFTPTIVARTLLRVYLSTCLFLDKRSVALHSFTFWP